MELLVFLSKFLQWLPSWLQLVADCCNKAARNLRNYAIHLFLKISSPSSARKPTGADHHIHVPHPNLPKAAHMENLVCDVNGTVVIPPHEHDSYGTSSTDHDHDHDHGDILSFFPYFMLVAFEAGSIIRAFLLLVSYPLILWGIHSHGLRMRAMVFITFCGLKVKDMETVARAVLPKFYLENLSLEVFHEMLEKAGGKMVITSVPRVMVEGFLKEYLQVGQIVVATELQTVVGWGGKSFTGLLGSTGHEGGLVVKHRVAMAQGRRIPDIGLIGTSRFQDQDSLLLSLCKEGHVVGKSSKMARDRYPKPPLVFHDGRLAFLPTPRATLAMFMWLPLGLLLALFRILVGILLPYKLIHPFTTFLGLRMTFNGPHKDDDDDDHNKVKGVLYVCNHRTLLDPVMLDIFLAKPLTALTYSLSKMSEILAPLRTVRLTRDRKQDRETMERMLSEGDLVVCPEGTTCREPYLLRFSSLFTELADEIVPVAINSHVTMFYGTTAGGLKCLDSWFFLMNPKPCYHVNVLGKLPRDQTCAGGKSSFEVANFIQRKLANALGFQCTNFTRKDKYMMLAAGSTSTY
ncbi:hypothetical protein Dimus_009935 [Dionaea muscipula]